MHKSIHVPEGDVLIHAGDLTNVGEMRDVYDFAEWIEKLPHQFKIVIAGNHDYCFENDNFYSARAALRDAGVIFLQDDWTQLNFVKPLDLPGWKIPEGIPEEFPDHTLKTNIYGTPWQPTFHNWAFNLNEGQLAEKWAKIPPNTDILVVHGPPHKIRDKTQEGAHHGSTTLLNRINEIKPGLVVCGHIHEDRGVYLIEREDGHDTWVVNASCVTRRMRIQPGDPFIFKTTDGKTFDRDVL
jgi:Icc-related predicted phosphoesterase